ncbi:MAG: hypothetical protein GY861_25390 [bacterium]|nr:hypothetical protein [bacterium]
MENNGDFHVALEEHLQALQLDDEQREAAESILEDADALIGDNGTRYISIHKYIKYVLFRLDEIGKSAIDSQSLKDLEDYESITRGFLSEWAIIIGGFCHQFAEHRYDESTHEVAKSLKELMDDVQTIYEHLNKANELFIEFGRAKDNSDSPRFELE